MTTQCVQVKLELGHRATIRTKPTSEGFTHDWTMFVRGPEGSCIEHFVDRVVFQLHESFPKPKRVVKDPPFQVSQAGYAGFEMAIDVYFRNKEEPKKVRFLYDLFLHLDGQPPVNHIRCEKLTFRNPTEDFRRKLLRAGGVGVMPMELDIPATSTKLNATGGKPSAPGATPATDPSAFTKGKPQSAAAAASAAAAHQGSKKPKSMSSSTTSSASTIPSKESGKGSTPKTKEPKETTKPKTSTKDSKSSTKDTKTTTKESKTASKSDHKASPREPKPSPKEPKPTSKESKPSQKVSYKDIKSSSESKSSSKDNTDSKPSGKAKESSKQTAKRSAPEASPVASTPSKKRKQSTSTKEKEDKNKSKDEIPHDIKTTKSKAEKSQSSEKQKSTPSEKGSKSKEKTSKAKKSTSSSSSSKAAPPESDQGLFTPEITKSKTKSKAKQAKEPKKEVKELPPFDAELSTEEQDNDAPSPSSSISFSSLTIPGRGGGTGTLGMLMQDLDSEDNQDDDDHDMERPFQNSAPPAGRHRSMSGDSNLSSNSRHSSPSPEIIEKPKPVSKSSYGSNKKSGTTGKKGSKVEKKPKNVESKQKSSQNSNIDYLYELVELHKRLMKLTDRDKLQQVVDLIGETGSFKVTDTTFDFDLCSLDKSTVRRLQEYVPTL